MGNLSKILAVSLLLFAEGSVCSNASIHWSACPGASPSHSAYQCANLTVPRDYTTPSDNRTIQLELLRVPAAKQPSKGSILFNFGGPGIPNRKAMNASGDAYLAFTGGEYDLVTFDSRGTANTLPFQCYETDIETVAASMEYLLPEAYHGQLGRLWARGKLEADMCAQNARETGEVISTAFVARDLMSTVDALGEDGMLRYWGLSYGTTLGATVAAMFPDRIDKMVLDSVQNPYEYYHGKVGIEQWIDADRVFSDMFKYCVKAGAGCALATDGLTAEQLQRQVLDLLRSLKLEPIYDPSAQTLIDYTTLQGTIFGATYGQGEWGALFEQLKQIMSLRSQTVSQPQPAENSTHAQSLARALISLKTAWGLRGIQCGDGFARTTSLEEFKPAVKELFKASKHFGGISVSLYTLCNQWIIKPKGSYQGNFNVKTKNPVLFAGASYDAHTSIQSARNLSATFEGSAILEWDGYGHGIESVPSKCSYEAMTAYWRNGTLPEKGKVCPYDSAPFSKITWSDILPGVFPPSAQ